MSFRFSSESASEGGGSLVVTSMTQSERADPGELAIRNVAVI